MLNAIKQNKNPIEYLLTYSWNLLQHHSTCYHPLHHDCIHPSYLLPAQAIKIFICSKLYCCFNGWFELNHNQPCSNITSFFSSWYSSKLIGHFFSFFNLVKNWNEKLGYFTTCLFKVANKMLFSNYLWLLRN